MLLRAMVRKAVAWRWVDRDPLPSGAFARLPRERGRVDDLAPEGWRALRDALEDDLRPVFQTLLDSGSRLNEVLSLTWGDVDLPGRKITFTMRKVGGRLKSRRISSALAAVLEAPPRGIGAAPVFTRADGSPWPDHEVKRRYYRAARRAGTRSTWTMHSVRHASASWLAIDGVPLRTISELLGHSSVAMTFRYAHLSPADLQEAVERIENVGKSGPKRFGRNREAAPDAVSHSRD